MNGSSSIHETCLHRTAWDDYLWFQSHDKHATKRSSKSFAMRSGRLSWHWKTGAAEGRIQRLLVERIDEQHRLVYSAAKSKSS